MENIDWEIIYKIRIVSLNTTWVLNQSQIYRLPLLKNILNCNGDFKEDSYLNISQAESNDFHYFENSILNKKEYNIILENIFEEDTELTPETVNLLFKIDWIFELPEEKWSLGQHQIYKILNPLYHKEINLTIYECINCKIKITEDLLNIKQECKFHGEIIKSTRHYGDLLNCKNCGFEINGTSLRPPCLSLPKHCFVLLK
ncbi:hypothetical protein CPAV1605_464 [seawater metagenome]|uniref:Uncharacterized protein n=1 Tax=seawater metagenome TaxID=1561972 RepID=A0A5E8CJE2_9ZZZZ